MVTFGNFYDFISIECEDSECEDSKTNTLFHNGSNFSLLIYKEKDVVDVTSDDGNIHYYRFIFIPEYHIGSCLELEDDKPISSKYIVFNFDDDIDRLIKTKAINSTYPGKYIIDLITDAVKSITIPETALDINYDKFLYRFTSGNCIRFYINEKYYKVIRYSTDLRLDIYSDPEEKKLIYTNKFYNIQSVFYKVIQYSQGIFID